MAVQNKTERLIVRLTPTHMKEVREKAEAEGYRLSEWVRLSLLERDRSGSTAELCGQAQG
jgi:hypothetical protein